MKKWLFGFVALLVFSPLMSQAAGLPGSANLDFRVVNISMDNKDAESVGVRPGDVLRYELELRSASEDVNDYVASIDVSGIADHVEFIELGLGTKSGNQINYPSYSHAAPCRQVWTFFARFKGCDGDVAQLSAQSESLRALVPTSCDAPAPGPTLPSTGPTRLLIIAFLAIIGIFCFGHLAIRRS